MHVKEAKYLHDYVIWVKFNDGIEGEVEFSENQVDQTKEINENIYIDLEKNGNLVNMTIEHASSQANIAEIAYQQIVSKTI